MFFYSDFIAKVNELGFISYTNVLDGFPKVSDYVSDTSGQWWTGDPDIDPSMWSARAAKEKSLVYGSFLNGKRSCISPHWYFLYYRAFHPQISVEERNLQGKLGNYEWLVWKLLEKENRMLGTHEIRKMLKVSPKSGASTVDTAVSNLIMTCDLTIAGEVDMLDKNGNPYNKSIGYDKLERWIPAEWIQSSSLMDPEQALEKIKQQLYNISKNASVENIAKLLRKQIKLYSIYI